ncbi:3,4-dihydroxy-2-butanone-4-phosphate synthase [Rhodococcus sp. NPDC059968]|uniref:3,4-dihydroxy-2-butanone-4-phosphate synthase n=1 Tax=Rhodococcus sp. NPDC059968 TaxID=3347017 RepID=UPI00366D57BF
MDGPTTRVQRALSDLSAGRPVVLTGNTAASDAHILTSAEKASVESIAFLVRYGSGLVCAAMAGSDCDRLQLPSMVGADRDHPGTEFTVSVDAVGPGTGISAFDRAGTLRLLADSASTPDEFTRPGHVLPARSVPGGVLEFRGPAEAAVDLMTIAGSHRTCAYSALVSDLDPTAIADSAEAETFARAHGLGALSIDDVATYRRMAELHMLTQFTFERETVHGPVRCVGYRSDVTGAEYVAYSIGSPTAGTTPLVSYEQESDPAPHLSQKGAIEMALAQVAEHGHGAVVVARRQSNSQISADTHGDLAEVVRECGYHSPSLHNFPPESRTMMWHIGLSISAGDSLSFVRGNAPAPFGFEQPAIVGTVVHGDQRGRELGFRTANLELEDSNSVADGVWAGCCTLFDGSTAIAAISIGRRPTFYGRSGIRLLEAHLLDFDGDLYGATLEVHLHHWMRGQVTFASKEELVAALAADVVRTRSLIAD